MSDQKPQHEQLGGKLLKTFYHFISTVRIHKDNNQLVKDCVTNLNAIISELSEDEELAIQIWRGRFHLQGEKLVYQRETFHIINEMLEYFSKRAGPARIHRAALLVFPDGRWNCLTPWWRPANR